MPIFLIRLTATAYEKVYFLCKIYFYF